MSAFVAKATAMFTSWNVSIGLEKYGASASGGKVSYRIFFLRGERLCAGK